MNILLVEDDADLGDAVWQGLGDAGHRCDWVRTLGDARRFQAAHLYDAVLLDLLLPDGHGIDWLRGLRERGDPTPVLVLSALGAIGERVQGLDLGADDYLVKPFAMAELQSRLRVITRRGHRASAVWRDGHLTIDTAARTVIWAGAPLRLARREFDILLALAREPGAVLTRQQLARTLADGETPESNAVDVHVYALRKKMGAAAIATWRGVGYQLRTDCAP